MCAVQTFAQLNTSVFNVWWLISHNFLVNLRDKILTST